MLSMKLSSLLMMEHGTSGWCAFCLHVINRNVILWVGLVISLRCFGREIFVIEAFGVYSVYLQIGKMRTSKVMSIIVLCWRLLYTSTSIELLHIATDCYIAMLIPREVRYVLE